LESCFHFFFTLFLVFLFLWRMPMSLL
jgi:hypothetical protein